jgi:hypothetical protein
MGGQKSVSQTERRISSVNLFGDFFYYSCDSVLFLDLYQITMAYAYWKARRTKDVAVFDLFFRKSPFHGEFTIFAGLSECLKFLENFHYSDSGTTLQLLIYDPFINTLKQILQKLFVLQTLNTFAKSYRPTWTRNFSIICKISRPRTSPSTLSAKARLHFQGSDMFTGIQMWRKSQETTKLQL